VSVAAHVPTVVENEGGSRERAFDIYSRLLKDRIVMIGRPINDIVANLAVAELIYLQADDPTRDISMYINSPGGSVTAGFAIYDTMRYVSAPISTVAIGRTASFGSILLMAGEKGKRFALPNARIHLHQPLIAGRGMQGQATDLDIHARELLRIKDEINRIIAEQTGQSLERVERDTDRDFFLSPEEAIEYGLIDAVIGGPVAAGVAAAG
jgi:ATP-dependent Clp protease protease subunit